MLLVVDPRDRRAALGAGLAEPVVHAVHVLVALALLAQLERLGEVVSDRGREPADLLGRQLGRELERRQVRPAEDFVRMRATDAGQRALVAEQRMKLPPLVLEDRSQ